MTEYGIEMTLKSIKEFRSEQRIADWQIEHLGERIKDATVDKKYAEKILKELYAELNQELRQGDESVYFDKQDVNGVIIKCRKQPVSVVITDEKALLANFTRTTITMSPDKPAIKEAIELGFTVPGAELSAEVYKVEVEYPDE